MAEEQAQVQVERGEVTPAQMEEIESGDYFTPKQLADKFRYSYQWVLWRLQQGRIAGIKPFGGNWRIPKSEVERIEREGLPPMPREKPKPPVTKIKVTEDIADKVREPEEKGKSSGGLFPFNF